MIGILDACGEIYICNHTAPAGRAKQWTLEVQSAACLQSAKVFIPDGEVVIVAASYTGRMGKHAVR